LIFRKALAGELSEDSGLYDIYCLMAEIDVQKEGVKGAKNFFEAKVRYCKVEGLSQSVLGLKSSD